MIALIFAAASFLNEPTLRGAHTGFYAVDPANGSVLASINQDDGFIPASTMKLLTASTALDLLPDDFNYRSTLESDARVDVGTLRGSLVLRGGGDASLDRTALDDAARALQARGVTAIAGDLVADSTRYTGPRYPPGWVVDDLPNEYAAPVTALAYEDNAVTIRVVPGRPGEPASLQPAAIAGLPLSNATRTAAGDDTIDVAGAYPAEGAIVVGSIPPGATPDELGLALPDPPAFALLQLRAALNARGITVAGTDVVRAAPAATVLWEHRSAGLDGVLERFLPPSNNLMGELLLNELGARTAGDDTTAARGIAAERDWLAGIGVNAQTLTIADGSGLSTYDRMTPRAMVEILRHDWTGKRRTMLMNALPRAGESGTLAHAFTGTRLAHIVVAKTGSMNHVRALAGYVLGPRRVVAFALLVDDWMDTGSGAAGRLERAREDALDGLL